MTILSRNKRVQRKTLLDLWWSMYVWDCFKLHKYSLHSFAEHKKWRKMKQLNNHGVDWVLSFRISTLWFEYWQDPKVVGMRLSIKVDTTLCIIMSYFYMWPLYTYVLRYFPFHVSMMCLNICVDTCMYTFILHIYIYTHTRNWIHIQPTYQCAP